jgi:multiple sugar transport system permease protein
MRAVAALLAVIWLVPLAWALDTALKPESETTRIPTSWIVPGMSLDAFGRALTDGSLVAWLGNSLLVGVAVTALTVAVTSLAAYGLSRTQFRGRGVVMALLVAGIVIPPQVLIVPLFAEMVGLGLADTYWALILPQVVLPAMVYVLKRFFDGVPRELEEAAVMDGAGRLRVYWSLMLPLARPALAAVAIFTFVTTWNNFLWPFVAVSDPHLMTFPVGLATVQSSYGVRYAQVLAAALLGGLPLVALFLAFQRQLVTAIKG